MRILLTEGSGLTSRQVATRLGELGHEVEVLSSTPLCLARFTNHVRRVHAVPPFGARPLVWLDAALAVARERRVDAIFPTQEQVTVLSAFAARLPVPTVVPPFAALVRVQDKDAAVRTLAELGLPQPRSRLVTDEGAGEAVTFPVYVKRPVSTASSGVRRAGDRAELAGAVRALGLDDGGLLIQDHADGPLAMVQAIADGGRLVAWHANLRVREGARGGAAIKVSVTPSGMAGHLATLVAALGWHGPIALDAILTRDGPVYIDVNPRLVEPRNAWLAGIDLVALMLALGDGDHPPPVAPGRPGVRSHQLLLAILGAARATRGRRAVVRELVQAARGTGDYAGSVEELTPIRGDLLAAAPIALVAAATLAWPRAGSWFSGGSVEAYALTAEGWSDIRSAAGAGGS